MTRIKYNAFLVLLFLIISSCEKVENKPKDPLWGKQSCSNCRMILSEKRYAAQRVLTSGKTYYYDDINCALIHRHGVNDGVLYVRPHGGSEWIDAKKARYNAGLMTPMDSGVGAVKDGGNLSFEDIKDKWSKK